MKKPDNAVLKQTARVALGVAILVAVMLAVYAVIGRLKPPVVFGALYSGALGILNFYVMGRMLQGIADRMAERQRTEQEIADLSLQMQNRNIDNVPPDLRQCLSHIRNQDNVLN